MAKEIMMLATICGGGVQERVNRALQNFKVGVENIVERSKRKWPPNFDKGEELPQQTGEMLPETGKVVNLRSAQG